MRITLLAGVAAGLLAGAGAVRAQSFPTEVSIALPTVQVRSGPSDKFYPTGELRQGDKVIVVRAAKDQPGWLEIKPPPGSFSWVNSKYVKEVKASGGTYGAIDAAGQERVTALIGSAVYGERPSVVYQPGFLTGSIVLIVDRPRVVDGETWLPVQPDLREVRYIPANAVRALAPVTTTAAATWAIGAKSNPVPTTPIPGHPSAQPAPGSTTAFSPTPAPVVAPLTKQWSTYGRLRTTTFTSKTGQPMYILVDAKEQPLLYVSSNPGTSLRSYINQTVSVYGTFVNQVDDFIRVPFIVASHVAVP